MNTAWTSFLNGILSMPGAKVDRKQFLMKCFTDLSTGEMLKCLEDNPTQVMPLSKIDEKASRVINAHLAKVTAISTLAGIPGGLTMLATIPADLANYYYHVVTLGQKLGYLYGYPDLLDENGELTEEGKVVLTSFIGAMNNVKIANEVIKKIAVELGKRIPGEAMSRAIGNLLSKQIVAHSVEAIAKKLGTQITSSSVSRGVTKAIPVISGVICGGITYNTFRKQAKRLHQTLHDSNVLA